LYNDVPDITDYRRKNIDAGGRGGEEEEGRIHSSPDISSMGRDTFCQEINIIAVAVNIEDRHFLLPDEDFRRPVDVNEGNRSLGSLLMPPCSRISGYFLA